MSNCPVSATGLATSLVSCGIGPASLGDMLLRASPIATRGANSSITLSHIKCTKGLPQILSRNISIPPRHASISSSAIGQRAFSRPTELREASRMLRIIASSFPLAVSLYWFPRLSVFIQHGAVMAESREVGPQFSLTPHRMCDTTNFFNTSCRGLADHFTCRIQNLVSLHRPRKAAR
ncbi:unnamed protein product [Trypanosoma congolense IL3000]|uniref:WGS project CAEQ00000000 data, annotated contig 1500 n=1 Tax=Trypanosoma congolense (strain IL3000) TaxID=1068625 RepID=F9W6Q0_TRYCI|nr:unnamed protein product [Trypanosoma congolense IL3000]